MSSRRQQCKLFYNSMLCQSPQKVLLNKSRSRLFQKEVTRLALGMEKLSEHTVFLNNLNLLKYTQV